MHLRTFMFYVSMGGCSSVQPVPNTCTLISLHGNKWFASVLKTTSACTDIVIIGIILVLARTLGLQQNVCCVKESHVRITFSCSNPYSMTNCCCIKESRARITFSCNNLHDMTNSTIEIPEVRVQLPEWQETVHLYVQQTVQMCGNHFPQYLLTQDWMNTRVLADKC